MHGLEKEYGSRIDFVRVNVLDAGNEPMLEKFGFNTTPEFYLIDEQGNTLGFWSEGIEADDLRRKFDAALAP